MFWVVVKEREHGSLVYVSGGGVNHRLFRVRSGRNLNLSFSLYGFCDLGQANSPSESSFPSVKGEHSFTLHGVGNFKAKQVNHLPPVST